jgi:hypothetical protein
VGLKAGLAEVAHGLRPEAEPEEVQAVAEFLAARPDLWHALTREERAKLARGTGDVVRKIVHVIQKSWDGRPRGHRNHPCPACGRATMYPVDKKPPAGASVEWLERCDSCGRDETRAY